MDEMNTVGTLYIVATPIGNARDMTERGRQILETADIIAAEDTRRSVVLLNKLGIRGNQLSANHKFNEYGKAKWFIEQLRQGKSIAVITDAGTPCISDPGNELIRAAIDAGIRVVGVPGCCAAVTALSISGFDLSTFFFFGFFPREAADRRRALAMMRRGDTRTYCFYESPKRIMDAVEFFISEHAGVLRDKELHRVHDALGAFVKAVGARVAAAHHGERTAAVGSLPREEAEEKEGRKVEARDGQRRDRGAAAGHADHADARVDGGTDQLVAGVGDAGRARVGDDGDALALPELLDEPLRLAVFVELVVGGELVAADAELVEQHDAAAGVLRRDDVRRL